MRNRSVRSEYTTNLYTDFHSHPSRLRFRFLQYALLFLGCMVVLGCSKARLTTPTVLLRESLQNWETIGTYVGYNATKQVLYLGNHLIERRFHLDRGDIPIQTIYYAHKESGQNLITVPGHEFKFRVGEIEFSGDSNLLRYTSYEVKQSKERSKHLIVELSYSDETEKPIFCVKLHYEISPHLPIIYKWMTFENLTDSTFFLEDIVIESLPIFSNRKPQLSERGSESIEHSKMLRFIHESNNGGMILGNEAPGISRHDNTCSTDLKIELGLTPTASINGVEIRVSPHTPVSSPKTWSMLFSEDHKGRETFESIFPTALWYQESREATTPSITWTRPPYNEIPVGDFIVADYDWDREKLSALKQLSNDIHDNGSKFGIRFPLAELNVEVLNHGSWSLTPTANFGKMTQDAETRTNANLPRKRVYCVLSDYGYFISRAVAVLFEEVEVDLFVFDGPIIGIDGDVVKGCGASGHTHFSRRESVDLIYRWLFEFADHLHQQHPKLQLGITSTAYGTESADFAVYHHFDLFVRQ